MVDVREIDGAIAEIENSELTMTRVKNLAALYVVKNQQLADVSPAPQKAEWQEPARYYEAAEPPTRAAVGGSDFLQAVSNVDTTAALNVLDVYFLQAVSNVDTTAALNVLDELMSALYVTNPKVYNNVMRKLERLQDE